MKQTENLLSCYWKQTHGINILNSYTLNDTSEKRHNSFTIIIEVVSWITFRKL